MRVLMIGWELPPFNSGGLGVACFHLAKELNKRIDLTFTLP
jgi:glycogen synthase